MWQTDRRTDRNGKTISCCACCMLTRDKIPLKNTCRWVGCVTTHPTDRQTDRQTDRGKTTSLANVTKSCVRYFVAPSYQRRRTRSAVDLSRLVHRWATCNSSWVDCNWISTDTHRERERERESKHVTRPGLAVHGLPVTLAYPSTQYWVSVGDSKHFARCPIFPRGPQPPSQPARLSVAENHWTTPAKHCESSCFFPAASTAGLSQITDCNH